MYDIIWQIYHTWCFHCCMYQICGRRYKKYSFVLLCEQKISYTDVSEITSQVIWSLKWAIWLHINILLYFSCGRKEFQLVFHVTSPTYVCQSLQHQAVTCTKKSFWTEILPSEVSYLYSYGSKIYIWYCCSLLTMWFISNICFWEVISYISWFEIHCIVGVGYVSYVSGDVPDSQILLPYTCTVLYSLFLSTWYLLHWQIHRCGRFNILQFWKVRKIWFWVRRVL